MNTEGYSSFKRLEEKNKQQNLYKTTINIFTS